MTRWVYDDGGRRLAGFRGEAGDCVARAIAIALEEPYAEVYRALANLNANTTRRLRDGRVELGARSARNGLAKQVYRQYLFRRGWTWTPTMKVGQGTTVHLRSEELPGGRIICKVSKHLVAVIDGVVHDTHDPTRDGTRAVYGYYSRADQ